MLVQATAQWWSVVGSGGCYTMPGCMAGRGGTLAGELGGGWVDYLIVTITVQGDAA